MKAQPTRLAHYNRAAILNLVRRFGPISQAELAQRSGLASSSVVNVTRSLLRWGLLRSIGTGPSTGGRPPTLLEVNPGAGYALGVNVRAVGIEVVLLDLAGDIVADTFLPGRAGDGSRVVATVREAVEQVLRLGSVDPGRVLGVGVACPGAVQDGRILAGTPEFPDWHAVPLADDLETALGLPVVIENNANLAALAEFRLGIGRDDPNCRSLVYIYADHGIGSGIVIDGQLWRGADGMAGEFGHTVVDVNGRRCVCGTYGCLEAMASIRAVIRRVATNARVVDGVEGEISYPLVTEAVRAGDPVATAAVEEAMGYLSIGIANLERLIRPDVIAMGGDLFSEGPDMFARLSRIAADRSPLFGAARVRLAAGALGARAPSVGAGTVVLDAFFGVPERAITPETVEEEGKPAFESAPLWPVQSEDVAVGWTSDVVIAWAGELACSAERLRSSDPVTVTVRAQLQGEVDPGAVKALLHWDRVSLFGGSWPYPKNSPMRVAETDGDSVLYRVTLGSLPIGKYEFAVRLLGANEVWVPGPREPNGRFEVLASHLFAAPPEEVGSEAARVAGR